MPSLGPDLAHRVAEAVVAQRGDVVDLGLVAHRAGQIHRGVQRVAAEALLQAAVGALLQFDHALANQGDARGVRAQGAKGVHLVLSLLMRGCLVWPHRWQASSHKDSCRSQIFNQH
jgi:hypothetical protein